LVLPLKITREKLSGTACDENPMRKKAYLGVEGISYF
jgi:hypothetical protein